MTEDQLPTDATEPDVIDPTTGHQLAALPWRRYAVVAVAIVAALLVVSVIVDVVTWAGSVTGGSAWWVAARHVVVDPLARWVARHQGDLPWSATSLTTTWWILGALLFLASLLEVTAARIGWVLFGAGTAAAVYAGTAAPAQPVAAATVGAAWVVLSLFALHGPAVRRPLVTAATPDADSPTQLAPGPERVLVDDLETVQPQDELARVARTFELLLRRRAARSRHAGTARPRPHWTVTGGDGYAFTAHHDASPDSPAPSWHAAGLAFSPDALAEALALIHPAGTTPTLRWERDELRPALWTRGMNVEPPALHPFDEFIQDSPLRRADLVARLQERHRTLTERLAGDLSLGALGSRLSGAAERLNAERPLLHDVRQLQPEDRERGDFVATASFHDWVDVPTIVKTADLRWNQFDDHRPRQVVTIARGLLGGDPELGDDLEAAVRYVLGVGGHLSLARIPGPAGPIHAVLENGLHRTHAFALLDLPVIAAEVTVTALPVRITAAGIGTTHEDPDPAPLWRGLIRAGLLEGRIEHDESAWIHGDPKVLYPTWVAAPWMLLTPRDAAKTAAAYDRIYPGALHELGVPTDVLGNPDAWTTWLTQLATRR